MRSRTVRLLAGFGAVLACVALATTIGATSAFAEGPRWHVNSTAMPTNLPPGGEGIIYVLATNLGDAAVNGSEAPVTITDKLPPGLHATGIAGDTRSEGHVGEMTCALSSPITCTFAEPRPLAPFGNLAVRIAVKVEDTAASGTENEVTVAGGETTTGTEAPSATVKQPIIVNGARTPFGIEQYELTPENEDGSLDIQAGSHPFQLTTTLGLNTRFESGVAKPAALPKDLHFNLPAGLIGNPTAIATCTDVKFFASDNFANQCPADTAVGVVSTTITEPATIQKGEPVTSPTPVFNLPPSIGEPARFGFLAYGIPVIIDTAVRSGGDYGVTVSSDNILQTAGFVSSQVTFWGVPSDPRHDASRGWACLDPGNGVGESNCNKSGTSQSTPFLTLPTSCPSPLTAPFETTVEGDSWPAPGRPSELAIPASHILRDNGGAPLAMDGCNQLPFEPSINVTPDGQAASTPTGLTVGLHVPQQASVNPEGLSESDVKNTTVTLPAALQVNPAAAAGLQACSEAAVGFQRLEGDGEAIFSEGEAQCPAASKLGTVKITTPLLSEPLEGAVYQAAQDANPFGSLLALYIVAEAPKAGVRVKLSGEVSANPATGQLTSTFKQTPQLPFEAFDLKFFGGGKAPLATSSCGTYETETSIEPWSGNPAASPSSEFTVTTGPNGTPCQNPQPFAPSFIAGVTGNQAGSFSPFTLTLSRSDGEQAFSTITTQMPVGLLGMLSKVTLCGEAQASAAACPAASQIGHVTVQAGVGNEPITLPEAGKPQDPVYLTGPYRGAPFGLAIVVPAEAGPFNLDENGRPVIVRAAIHVDRRTSQITIDSDPMPSRLQGIPLDVRRIDVAIDKEGFTFNPTSCRTTTVNGTLTSTQGATEAVSSHFQAAGCSSLRFKPKFTVLTQAKTSKANGASLHVKVVSGPGQANIRQVKVDLPLQLPSRLSTLQKACVAAVFEANPASCPAASVVGHGYAVTPVLRNELTGPAYLVSHGGAAFPDLEIVLQGEGITLILDGNTKIKKGITSSAFKAVPDAPISTFDLVLPTGPHSVLTGFGSLCKKPLNMPTKITGQNGAVIKQTTRIAVSGCSRHPKARSKRRARNK